jgi:beta-N-acetylhexosaminidase
MDNIATLGEICGQVILGGYEGEKPSPSMLKRLALGHVAGVILFKRNIPSVEASYDTCGIVAREAKYRPFLSVDQEGGRVARLPPPVIKLPPMAQLGKTGDAKLAYRVGRELGDQLALLGFNVDFAPVLDVNTNPQNPVIGDRAFGDTAEFVGKVAIPFITGLQAANVLACGKHFPGHGNTSVDSHLALPTVDTSLAHMKMVELRPFEQAIEVQLGAIMSAHIVCAGLGEKLPATLSSKILRDLLRTDMGYDGLIFSDDLEMKAIADNFGIPEAAELAIEAGCDVVAICKDEQAQEQTRERLLLRAERDSKFRDRITNAAYRSLAVRRDLGSRRADSWEQARTFIQRQAAADLEAEIAKRVSN